MVLRTCFTFVKKHHSSYIIDLTFPSFYTCYCRRESLWPELDQLLLDGDDAAVSTPYTAAVVEYRVVFHDPEDAPLEDDNWSNANGHAVYDAQHPCRYDKNKCALWIF